MRFRLHTLLILLAIGPPMLAGIIAMRMWLSAGNEPADGNWEYRGQPPDSQPINL